MERGLRSPLRSHLDREAAAPELAATPGEGSTDDHQGQAGSRGPLPLPSDRPYPRYRLDRPRGRPRLLVGLRTRRGLRCAGRPLLPGRLPRARQRGHPRGHCLREDRGRGWLTVVLTPALVRLCFLIRGHYQKVSRGVSRLDTVLDIILPTGTKNLGPVDPRRMTAGPARLGVPRVRREHVLLDREDLSRRIRERDLPLGRGRGLRDVQGRGRGGCARRIDGRGAREVRDPRPRDGLLRGLPFGRGDRCGGSGRRALPIGRGRVPALRRLCRSVQVCRPGSSSATRTRSSGSCTTRPPLQFSGACSTAASRG